MKRAVSIVALVLGAAILSCAATYWIQTGKNTENASAASELEWLRNEFHLSSDQFERIKALHENYRPKCEAMCQRIRLANSTASRAISQNEKLTPEVQAALREAETVNLECRQAMLSHIYAVSSLMSPQEGRRYIEMMKEAVLVPAHAPDSTIDKRESH